MAEYLTTLRRFNRDVRLYILAWALIGFGFFGIQGVLFNLYLLRLGYDAQFIGMFTSVGLLVWALCTVPAGAVGKRIGNRNAFIAGLVLSMTANGMVLFVEAVPASMQVGWLIVWWLPRWLGTALATVNSTPYLTGITRSDERKHAFSSQQAAMAVSAFLGSLVAGFLPGILAWQTGVTPDAAAPYRAVLWLTPLFYLAAIALLLKTQTNEPAAAPAQAEPDGPRPLFFIVIMGVVVFLAMVGQGTVRAFFNVYMDTELEVSTVLIGTLMGIGQLLPVVAAMLAPLMMVRWGAGRTLTLSIAGVALGLLMLALVPHWLGASAAFVCITAMQAVFGPSRNLYTQEAVSPAWRTAISTATTMGLALGWSAAAWSGSVVLGSSGFAGVFAIGALSAAASAGLLQIYMSRHRESATEAVPAAANA